MLTWLERSLQWPSIWCRIIRSDNRSDAKMDALAERYEAGKLYLQRPVNEILPPSLLLYLIPPLPPLRYVAVSFVLGCLLLLRVWWVLPIRKGRAQQRDPKRTSNDACTVGVFLGSGGHTTEFASARIGPSDRALLPPYLSRLVW